MRNLSILLFLSVALSACASSPKTFKPEPPPAALRQPCPQLPVLTEKTGAAAFLWSREVVRLYNDCAARHDALTAAWPN